MPSCHFNLAIESTMLRLNDDLIFTTTMRHLETPISRHVHKQARVSIKSAQFAGTPKKNFRCVSIPDQDQRHNSLKAGANRLCLSQIDDYQRKIYREHGVLNG